MHRRTREAWIIAGVQPILSRPALGGREHLCEYRNASVRFYELKLSVGVGNLRIVRLRKRTLRLVSIAVLIPILAIAIAFSVPAAKRVAHRRAESIACGNYMVSIMFAARLWASDHGEELPPKLLMMSHELNSPKILHCPGDHKRQRVGGWLEFTDADSSYEILTASTLGLGIYRVYTAGSEHSRILCPSLGGSSDGFSPPGRIENAWDDQCFILAVAQACPQAHAVAMATGVSLT